MFSVGAECMELALAYRGLDRGKQLKTALHAFCSSGRAMHFAHLDTQMDATAIFSVHIDGLRLPVSPRRVVCVYTAI